jgi:CheY-like chemotaxis protein
VRVLIVEDGRKLAQVLGSTLQSESYDVVPAATGQEGLRRVTIDQFDLIPRCDVARDIWLESSDRGSVFHISLPIVHRSEGAST